MADHNICHYQAEEQGGWTSDGWNDITPMSLDEWQEQTGFGANSLNELPVFISTVGPDYDLRPDLLSSPLIDAGHPTLSAPKDFSGNDRDASPDVGAHEAAGSN